MKIGELARSVGVSVQTVRYYERRGLLPEPARTRSGYRSYDHEALLRLRFILTAKGLGFTLSEVGELIDLRVDPATNAEDVRTRARQKIQTTKAKIADLRRLLDGLERLVAECDAGGSPHACALMHSLDVEETI
jgi:MerR family copper efflux transcriptional regulator